jgi:hypothetical protein
LREYNAKQKAEYKLKGKVVLDDELEESGVKKRKSGQI